MIYVIEPQCKGYEHLENNVIFVDLIRSIFPGKEIAFYAYQSHAELVNLRLGELNCVKNIESLNNCGDIYSSKDLIQCLHAEFKPRKDFIEKVIFLSIGSEQAFYVNRILGKHGYRTYLFMHYMVSEIASRPSYRPNMFVKWIYFTLAFNSKNVEHIVFSHMIADRLNRYLLGRHKVKASLLPYDMTNNLKLEDIDLSHYKRDPFVFVFPGEGRIEKGVREFIDIGRQYSNNSNVQFIVSGRVKIDPEYCHNSGVDCIFSDQLISETEYRKRLEKANYFVLLHEPEIYKYISSGVLLEAVKSEKPIIAIRNPAFEEFFSMYGDIGYLAESALEVSDIINFVYLSGNRNREKFIENLRRARMSYRDDSLNSLRQILL